MFTLDAWNETFIVFSNNLTSFKIHLHVHTRCLEDQISLHFYKLEIFSSLALKREKSISGDLWRILVHSLLTGMNQPSSMIFIKKEKNEANFIKAYFLIFSQFKYIFIYVVRPCQCIASKTVHRVSLNIKSKFIKFSHLHLVTMYSHHSLI